MKLNQFLRLTNQFIWVTILELSKWLKFEFHYNFNKNFDAELLFTDTLSLAYEIRKCL